MVLSLSKVATLQNCVVTPVTLPSFRSHLQLLKNLLVLCAFHIVYPSPTHLFLFLCSPLLLQPTPSTEEKNICYGSYNVCYSIPSCPYFFSCKTAFCNDSLVCYEAFGFFLLAYQYWNLTETPQRGIHKDILLFVALYHGDPVVLDLWDWPLYTLQQLLSGVDVGQLKALDLPLRSV